MQERVKVGFSGLIHYAVTIEELDKELTEKTLMMVICFQWLDFREEHFFLCTSLFPNKADRSLMTCSCLFDE